MAERGEHFRSAALFFELPSGEGPAFAIVVTSDRLLLVPEASNPPKHYEWPLLEGEAFDRAATLPGALNIPYRNIRSARMRTKEGRLPEVRVKYADASGKTRTVKGFVQAPPGPTAKFLAPGEWDEAQALMIVGPLSEPVENRLLEKYGDAKDE